MDRENPRHPLKQLWAAANASDQDAFIEAFGEWFLVGQLKEVPEESWSYQTLQTRTVSDPDAVVPVVLEEDFDAVAIRKRPGRPFKDQVYVGRSETNDICIPSRDVSKVHAVFDLKGNPEGLVLTDVGSSNGSSVNTEQALKDVKVNVVSGDQVSFGDRSCQVLHVDQLYSLLCRAKWN